MKKFAIAVLGLAILGMTSSAFADDTKTATPVQGSDAVATGYEWDSLCREAIHLQESRVRDLRQGVEFDREVERKLIEGIVIRERDATQKDEHARRWREHASRTQYPEKRDALNRFASWLENEARTDRTFASERREALRVINRQWNQSQNAIAAHERQLQDLHAFCDGAGG